MQLLSAVYTNSVMIALYERKEVGNQLIQIDIMNELEIMHA